jgi:outer membrane immunogenic protein
MKPAPHPNRAGEDKLAGAKRKETPMRIGFIFAGTALIAFLPAFQLSAQSIDGPTAGFDLRVAPRVVLGAEARVDLAADEAPKLSTAVDPIGSSDFTARAGYLLDPGTLAYVRGGYANPRLGTGALPHLSESEYRDSWTLGAGIERKILKRISARLEYRYSDLGEGDGAFDRHRLLAGIAYRF